MKKNDENFEKALHNSLKHSGYLFPTTDDEVTSFEKIYGKTDIIVPHELNDSKSILEQTFKSEEPDFEEHLSCAAFHSSEDSTSNDLLYDEDDNKNQDE